MFLSPFCFVLATFPVVMIIVCVCVCVYLDTHTHTHPHTHTHTLTGIYIGGCAWHWAMRWSSQATVSVIHRWSLRSQLVNCQAVIEDVTTTQWQFTILLQLWRRQTWWKYTPAQKQVQIKLTWAQKQVKIHISTETGESIHQHIRTGENRHQHRNRWKQTSAQKQVKTDISTETGEKRHQHRDRWK